MKKKIGFLWMLSCVLSLFSSCEKGTVVDYGYGIYYEEIVTAGNENVYLSDNGKTMLGVSEKGNKTYAAGDRVLLNYTLLPTVTAGYDYTVRINGSARITKGKPTLTNESSIHASIREPVLLESLWLGSHYLNMQFYLNYKSEAHKIGLLVDSTRLSSDTIQLYFTHDSGNDPPGYSSHVYLSFDLEETLGARGKEQPVSVRINTSNYGNKMYEFKY